MNLPKTGFWRGRRKLGKEVRFETDRRQANHIRSITHTFHTSRSDDAGLTKLNALGRKHDGFHATCADLVDSGSIGFGAHARTKSNLSGRRLTNTGLDNVSKVNFFNNGWIDILRGKSVFQGNRAELGSGESLEGTIDGTSRSTGSSDDDNFGGLEIWSDLQDLSKLEKQTIVLKLEEERIRWERESEEWLRRDNMIA